MRLLIQRWAVFCMVMCLAIVISSSAARAQNDSAKLFKAKCAACHGADGSGNTPAGKATKVRNLRSSEAQKQTDAELTQIITKGKNNKNKMPGYEKSLSGKQIHSLVGYVRSLSKKK